MKKTSLYFLIFLIITGCSAVIQTTGYAPEKNITEYTCGENAYTRVGPISAPRWEVIGPIVPLVPIRSAGASVQVNIDKDNRVSTEDCPVVVVNNQEFTYDSFSEISGSCNYRLSNIELDKHKNDVYFKNTSGTCATKNENYKYFSSWQYVPPGMVTK